MSKFFTTALSAVFMQAAALAATPDSGTLPVLVINTENNQPVESKEYYLNATYYLDNMGDESVDPIGSPQDLQEVQIKGRGNYTWIGFDKKPYKLKFPKKTAILGMNKSKHFALLAHADDNMGFMRNITGFELSRRLGLEWTPAEKPVEIYLNNDYLGLYFLTETIRIENTRVNITEQEDNSTADVDGGWLVEIDNYDTDPHIDVMEQGEFPIYFTYKSPEVLSDAQRDYLAGQLEGMNRAIYNPDKNSDEWLEYIDLESAVRYYIVQEILDDCESYHGSCYIYKDRGEGSKWHFGPVWDFGNSFGRGVKKEFIWQNPTFHQTWIGEIYKYPAFRNRVIEVWKEFCETGYAGLETYLSEYAAGMEDAAKSNYLRWEKYGNDNVKAKTIEMIQMLRKSVRWLGEQWGCQPDISDDSDPEVYVRGSFNNWSLTNPMEHLGDMRYVLNSAGNVMHAGDEFKIATDDWSSVDFGADKENMTPEPERVFTLLQRGKNIIVPEGVTADHKMVFDAVEGTLLFTTGTGVDNTATGEMEIPEIYTITGQRLQEMGGKGIYLLKYNDKKTIKVIK